MGQSIVRNQRRNLFFCNCILGDCLIFNKLFKFQLFDTFDLIGSFIQIKHRHIYHCYQADPEYGKGVAVAMNISIDDVDLNLPKRDSRENQVKANNMHPELNVPTTPVDPGVEIDTNTNDYIAPEEDPWLL